MAYFSEDLKLEPYWWEEAPRRPAPPAQIPKQADVVVVGSGYAGISTALTVARGGRSAIVFDAEDPGLGACSRNGGAVGETLRISFAAMIEQYGMAQATAYYKEVKNARAYVEHLIESEGIRCHYARVGRFMGAYLPQHYESLARDMELRQKHIGFDAEMVSKAEQHRMVGTDDYHGGRLIRSDANLHPALLHQGLLERAIQAGVAVVGRARVTAVERDGKGFIVTAGGSKVAAREVVIASNGYTGAESPWLRRRLIPIQSQIIATAPIAPELIERLIPARRQLGDTCKLHYYYRTSPDGARILFGGRAGGAEINDPRRSGMHLHRRLVELFPEISDIRITHSWAGFIAYTFDALPHMASHDGIHYVSGFCGSGVAMANYLGHKTGLKVLGSSDAANAFDSPHPTKPLYTGTPWFMPAVIAYYGWRDRMRI